MLKASAHAPRPVVKLFSDKALLRRASLRTLYSDDDSTARTVHGDNGFKHGAGAIAPGDTDSTPRSIKPGTNGSGYLHGVTNGTAVGFKFIVKATP